MASKPSASAALLLALNLLFFTLTSACSTCPSPTPRTPNPSSGTPNPGTPNPSSRTPNPSSGTPNPGTPNPSSGTPNPSSSPSSGSGTCPMDALKLGVCANVLNGLINVNLGKPPKKPCCSLLDGLVDLEAAVCLCTVLKANILGIKLNLPIHLSLLLNYCGKNTPKGFQCP